MKLHIFNPEHDIALATNIRRFTAPHAARQLRASLGFIPAFWAEDGDLVLVDDAEAAAEAMRHLKAYAHKVEFVTWNQLAHANVSQITDIAPWGWDMSLCAQLTECNAGLASIMPSSESLQAIRQMSNRRFAATELLPRLLDTNSRLTGKSAYCTTVDEVATLLAANGRSVMKAPWSCSGRGIRYTGQTLGNHDEGWCRNIIKQQGGIMVEPWYQKVCDFGMEFVTDGKGNTRYCGLSVFGTSNGAYSGSVLATEEAKRTMLARYVDTGLLDKTCKAIISLTSETMKGRYEGPFGIDMMAVTGNDGNIILHPCVEMNLRRTMGHVALALSPDEFGAQKLMRIYASGGTHKLRVMTTAENIIDNGLA